jgi:hypothetical protein
MPAAPPAPTSWFPNQKLLEEKDAEIARLNIKIIELQNQHAKFEAQKSRDLISRFELEVRQLNERCKLLKENEERLLKSHEKAINELLHDRIQTVQKLQIEVSSKESELIMLNKKLKNANYTLMLYKEQTQKFNQGKR